MMQADRSRKAARARLNEALARHLINDFTEHGAEVIAKLRRDKPADYLRMVTTAFQSDEPVPAPRSLNTDPKQGMVPVEDRPRGPKLWLLGPEIDEIARATSRRPFKP